MEKSGNTLEKKIQWFPQLSSTLQVSAKNVSSIQQRYLLHLEHVWLLALSVVSPGHHGVLSVVSLQDSSLEQRTPATWSLSTISV